MTTLQNPQLTQTEAEWLSDLRALADFLEANPSLIPGGGERFYSYVRPEDFPAAARSLGSAKKEATDEFAKLTKGFGKHQLTLLTDREEVCERVQVGERTVVREVLPEGVELVTEEVTEPVYEWRCDSWLKEDA